MVNSGCRCKHGVGKRPGRRYENDCGGISESDDAAVRGPHSSCRGAQLQPRGKKDAPHAAVADETYPQCRGGPGGQDRQPLLPEPGPDPRGQGSLRLCPAIIKLRDEARERVLRLREEEAGDIRIAASTIPATYILPYAIGGFRKKHPRIRTTVRTADSGDVIETVLDNGAEIGFIGKKPTGGKLIAEELWKDRLVLAVPSGHPLGEEAFGPCRRTFKGALRDPRERFRHPGSPRGNTCGKRAAPACRISTSRRSSKSSEAVKEAVIACLGISVISVHAIRRELKSGILAALAIEGCPIERSFYLIYRRQFDLMTHHKIFLDFIRTYRPPSKAPEIRLIPEASCRMLCVSLPETRLRR